MTHFLANYAAGAKAGAMQIQLYDTAARKKRAFEPLDEQRVTLYVCGPTVYARAHIGNARPPIVFDVLVRLLREAYGHDAVVYARNITDIEDKIIASCVETGQSIEELTQKYAAIYNDNLTNLNVSPPTIEPWASLHVPQMIDIIETLVRKGYAYVANEGVWFQVSAMSDYGKLSGRKQDDNQAGARVEVNPDKRAAADFALWKFAKPGEPEDAIWDSPWGKGRPGWHIECSAMAAAHLGKTIDIHGGGIDLQFPHHENEIAQSECAHGVQMARYWMHNGFLDMNGEKMSKSLGNVTLVDDLLNQWPGEVIRFAMLSGHYRAPLDWTPDLLAQAKTTLDRVYGALRRVWDMPDTAPTDAGVLAALCDDLNTPIALAEVSRLATAANAAVDTGNQPAMAEAKANLLAAGALLGLLTHSPASWEQGGDADFVAEVEALIDARNEARANKDWAAADEYRDKLTAMGIEIMDGAGGATWRRL